MTVLFHLFRSSLISLAMFSSFHCTATSCFLVKFISKQEFWFPYTFRKVVFTNHLLVYTNMVYRNSKKKNDAFKLWCWAKETRIERHTCTPIFITAPFIIARTWKQPRCPLADEWVRKLWYIYTMEYYSAIKKNAFESVLMRWMKQEPIIHSEVNQKEKHQYSILTHIYGI